MGKIHLMASLQPSKREDRRELEDVVLPLEKKRTLRASIKNITPMEQFTSLWRKKAHANANHIIEDMRAGLKTMVRR